MPKRGRDLEYWKKELIDRLNIGEVLPLEIIDELHCYGNPYYDGQKYWLRSGEHCYIVWDTYHDNDNGLSMVMEVDCSIPWETAGGE